MFIKNNLNSVNFKVMFISSRDQIWSKFYTLDSDHFEFFLLISTEIGQNIELISITYVTMLQF